MTPETRNPAGQGQGSRDYRGGDPVPPEKPEAICLDCQDKPGQLEEVGRLILDGLAKVPANLTEAALHYARHGWPVFPTTIKKEPLTAHGYKDATTDPAKIRTTFRNPRAAGVAIPTGTITGLVVLDRDRKNGADGVATCEALEADLGALPPTLQQRTGSGGDQLFFRYPEGVTIKNSSGKLGKGFDVRSTGGLVVLPPSHNEAGSYAWLNDLDPAPLPQTWVDFLKERPRPEVERKPAPGIVAMESTAYGRKALEAECQAVASEPQGSRNARLNQAAFAVGQLVGGGEINEDEARLALQQAAVACGLNDSEADKTIRSGLTAGMAEPRQAPGESDWNPNGGQTAGKNAEKEARAPGVQGRHLQRRGSARNGSAGTCLCRGRSLAHGPGYPGRRPEAGQVVAHLLHLRRTWRRAPRPGSLPSVTGKESLPGPGGQQAPPAGPLEGPVQRRSRHQGRSRQRGL
jgi:putative DNA primase/helicase